MQPANIEIIILVEKTDIRYVAEIESYDRKASPIESSRGRNLVWGLNGRGRIDQ